MALVIKDRVKETTTTTGTGTVTLAGAAAGFDGFSSIGDGNTTYYAIVDTANQAWEVGIGTYTASGTTLSRDTVLESSNSDALVDFQSGTKAVFCTLPAEKAVVVDENGLTTLPDGLVVTGNLTVQGTTTTIEATNLAVADNMIYLRDGETTGNVDLGFAGNYNDGTYAHAGFFRDATDGRWKVFDGYTPEPDAATDINTAHASFALADVEAANFYGDLTGDVTGNVSGNAGTADALSTARNIGLSGDASGSVSFDGSADATITVTVADDSHAHVIANVDGLQTALDAKQAASSALTTSTSFGGDVSGTYNAIVVADDSHNHVISNVDGLQTALDAKQAASTALTTSTSFGGDVSGTYNSIVVADDSHNHVISNVDGLQTALDAKLASSSYTAADVLTKIKTVDGSGSGLDADTVDGIQASSFLRSDASDTLNGVLTVNTTTDAQIQLTSSDAWAGIGFNDSGSVNDYIWYNGGNGTFAIGGGGSNVAGKKLHVDGGMSVGSTADATSTPTNGIYSQGEISVGGSTVWHSGNDGSGSGLDADTLDGYHLSTTRNSANTVPVRDANGYANFGWINTTSGNTTTAASDYYVNTNDGYIRKKTLANVRTEIMGVSSGGSFLRSDATDYLNSTMYTRGNIIAEDAYRNRGIIGTYNSSKTQQIWAMGTSYVSNAAGTNFGSLYGLAYKHTNNSTGGTMAGGHQMVWCQNGSGKAAMGTNIWTSGNVTAYSDIRVKTNLERIPDALEKVKKLNGYTFDRTDVEYDDNGVPTVPVRQTGVVAQEVLEVLPEAVTGNEEEHYSVAYGNMVGLLIEAIKEQQVQIDELKAKLG